LGLRSWQNQHWKTYREVYLYLEPLLSTLSRELLIPVRIPSIGSYLGCLASARIRIVTSIASHCANVM
jgi:hypothetical protein